MSFLDVLLGRQRPVKSRPERLFAIATAQVTLRANLGLTPGQRAGICFRPVTSARFAAAESELEELLRVSAQATSSQVEGHKDSYGFQWVLLADEEFEDLVALVHTVSRTLEDQGFGDRLLAAVFKFLTQDQQPVYWIYNYKRGQFYPFVPQGRGHQRDNATELRLRAAIGPELPVEPQIERWYALWDIPF